MTDSEPCLLTHYLGDAAMQARFMQPWQDDRKFVAAGGRLIWAVDADVVTLYADPAGKASWENDRIGYGQVFRDDDKKLSTAIAARLADYIFFKLSPDIPLLVIPPIETEVRAFWLALLRMFGDKPTPPPRDIDQEKILRSLGVLQNVASVNYATEQKIIDEVLNFIYFETGPLAQFRRLAQLFDLNRIGNCELLMQSSQLKTEIKNIFRPFVGVHELIYHAEEKARWFKELQRVSRATAKTTLVKLERDAEALARLTLWNGQVSKHNTRIVYLTGARHIFEAGWSLKSKNEKPFAELYLRHPRAFLSSPEVLNNVAVRPAEVQAPQYDPSQFADWLQTFLANFKVQGDLFRVEDKFALASHSREVAKVTANQQPHLAERFHSEWEKYTKNVRTAYRAPPSIQERIAEEFQNQGGAIVMETWQRVRRGLADQIRRKTDEAWESCFRIGTRTGFSFLFHEQVGRKIPSRIVPPLYFTEWQYTHDFISQIGRWHENADFDAEMYEKGISEIQKEESTGYAYYLAHAILFAGRGQWSIASILAARAIATIEPQSITATSLANGREAYYLMAHSRRHTIRNRADLDEARRLVQRASEIFDEERDKQGQFEAVPERFLVEQLAFKATELMFARFDERKSITESSSDPAGDLWQSQAKQLIEELRALLPILDKRIALAKEALSNSEGIALAQQERVVEILEELELRVSNNVVVTWLTMLHADTLVGPEFQISSVFKRLEKHLRHSSDLESGLEVSYIVQVTYLCASALLENVLSRRREKAKLALERLEEYEIKRNLVFPYDEARLLHFKELIESAIKLHGR